MRYRKVNVIIYILSALLHWLSCCNKGQKYTGLNKMALYFYHIIVWIRVSVMALQHEGHSNKNDQEDKPLSFFKA